MNSNLVLFDLDGTLALIDHRRHLVTPPAHDWDEFYAQCVNDTVNQPVAQMFDALRYQGYIIWIVSGRSAVVKTQTLAWLNRYCLTPQKLLMRPAKDYRPDVELKREWLNDGTIPRSNVLCVFDDRQSVVDMWRAEGLTCFQVAPGNF